MPWSVLLPILLEVIQSGLPAKLAAWLTAALQRWRGNATDDTLSLPVGAAPDDLKAMILDALKSAAGMIDRPVVKMLVLKGIDLFGGRLVDAIYDRLIAAGHAEAVPGVRVPVTSRPVTAAHAAEAADLEACLPPCDLSA